MTIRLAAPLQLDSIVDGEGLRAVIWTQGCPHNCLGCHNPSTHDYAGGYVEKIKNLKDEIINLKDHSGITFSGGDPFEQSEACYEIALHAHENNLNVWCYTGYTFESLLKLSEKNQGIKNFLNEIDVLIDGRFMIEFKSLEATFRGSTNQRIIDVPASLKTKKIVLIPKYKLEEKSKETLKTNIYI